MDQRLIIAFLIAIAVEILLPLFLALWLHNRLRISWRFFGYGAVVFLVSQIIIRIPAVNFLQSRLQDTLEASESILVAWIAFLSLTAGLFEESGRYLGYRFLWKKGDEKTWQRALMYGVGHGGLESMLLVGGMAIVQLIQVIVLSQIDLSSLSLPSDQVEAVRQIQATIAQTAWWMPLLGAFERIVTMAVHISLSLLTLQIFSRKKLYWWWLALGYHTLVNLASLLVLRYLSLWLTEVLLLLFALLSIRIIFWLRPGEEEQPSWPTTPPEADEEKLTAGNGEQAPSAPSQNKS